MAKPPKTKIKLRKNVEQLDIVVPCKRQLSKEAIHQVALTTVVNAIALFLVGFNLWVGITINRLMSNGDEARGLIAGWSVVLLFVIPLALWVVGAAFKNSAEMCKQVFSDTSVSINNTHLAMSTEFMRFDWGTFRRIKVKDITRIVVTDYKYIDGLDPEQAPCFLVLELDGGTVNLFAAEHRLSKAEAKWLGKELSRWLNVRLIME
jgi:hypothetical protein